MDDFKKILEEKMMKINDTQLELNNNISKILKELKKINKNETPTQENTNKQEESYKHDYIGGIYKDNKIMFITGIKFENEDVHKMDCTNFYFVNNRHLAYKYNREQIELISNIFNLQKIQISEICSDIFYIYERDKRLINRQYNLYEAIELVSQIHDNNIYIREEL